MMPAALSTAAAAAAAGSDASSSDTKKAKVLPRHHDVPFLLRLPDDVRSLLCSYLNTVDLGRLSSSATELLKDYGSKMEEVTLGCKKTGRPSPCSLSSLLNLLRRQESTKSISITPPETFLSYVSFATGGGHLRHLHTLKLAAEGITRGTGFALEASLRLKHSPCLKR